MGNRFGMDYGGTNVKAGVFGEDGTALVFREQPLADVASGGALLENLLALARDVARGYPLEGGGLAIKGLVNSERGVVEEDVGAGSWLAGIDLRAAFSSALGAPWVIENDARSYAWGEWMFGAGRGAQTMVCMTLGTGVGCSVVAGGRPYRGGSQFGALLGGHLTIDRNGPPCPCGNRGCLELYCSATALHQQVRWASRHPSRDGGSPRGVLRTGQARESAVQGNVREVHRQSCARHRERRSCLRARCGGARRGSHEKRGRDPPPSRRAGAQNGMDRSPRIGQDSGRPAG